MSGDFLFKLFLSLSDKEVADLHDIDGRHENNESRI